MPTTFLDSCWPQLGGKIAPESNELTDSEQSSFSRPNCQLFWLAHLIWICPAPVLLLELRKALRVMWYSSYWRMHPSGCVSPRQGRTNIWNTECSCMHPKNMVHTENLLERISRATVHSQRPDLDHWIALLKVYWGNEVPFQTNG